MKTKSLGFIGGGRITKIFLQALDNKQTDLSSVIVCDTNMEVLYALKKQFPKVQITDSSTLPSRQEIFFISLHPPVIMETLEEIKDLVLKNTLVISLAPKITIEKIAGKLATKNIARMIPNATSYINEGYNPICFSSEISGKEKQSVTKWLELLGKTFEVAEHKLEAYAIISAMLPTYFWFQWKELQDIGLQMGLNEKECKEAIQETLKAAIQLFYNSELNSEEVIDLIPVKPLVEMEELVLNMYHEKLIGLHNKIKS